MKKLQKLLISLCLLFVYDVCRGAEESVFDDDDVIILTKDELGNPVELPINPYDIICPEMNAAQRALLDEVSYEEKSIILAQIAGRAGFLASQYNVDVELNFLQLIRESFELANNILIKWQYKYEFIVSRTRQEEDPSWTDEEKRQVYLAQAAFQKLNRLSTHQDIHTALSEVRFHSLDDVTQQAFHMAVKQQLKITDIKDVCTQYVKNQQIKDFSKHFVQDVLDKEVAKQAESLSEKEFYKKALQQKVTPYSQQSFKGWNTVVDNLPVPASTRQGLEEID